GQLSRGRMQLLAEIAGRPATGLLAISQENDHPWLLAIVEHVRRLLDGRSERRAPGRRQGINLPHDAFGGVRGRLKFELDVALVVSARAIGDETHAAKAGHAWQDRGKRVPRLVDARFDGG